MPAKRNIEYYLQKFDITKEYLIDAYIHRKLSLPDIKNEKGIDFKACSKLLRYYEIPVRSISESKITLEYCNKLKNTLQEKYGVKNVSQIENVKEKKKKTFLSHYGVDNIWKSNQYYKWLDSYMISKFGKKRMTDSSDNASKRRKLWWSQLDIEKKEKYIQKLLKNLHKGSSLNNTLEVGMMKLLEILNVSFERRFGIKRYYVDFYVKQFNLVIECYGDYWHGNPIIYKPTDIITFPGKKFISAETLWNLNSKRIEEIKKLGYNCVIFWEQDVKKNPEKILEILKNETQKNN